jgi:hypothetical protein
MGSTNVEVEQKAQPEPISHALIANDEEKANDSPTEKESEPTFDTGLISWLQVLGSFFLFFNSWYVGPLWFRYDENANHDIGTGV